MESLVIAATKSTPLIHFDAESGVLEIRGKSYPENASKFYGPILDWLKAFLDSTAGDTVKANLEIIYLNSSSSKAFLNMFDMLEKAAGQGRSVVVNWYYHEDNEAARQCGEEFMEDLESLDFHLLEITDE